MWGGGGDDKDILWGEKLSIATLLTKIVGRYIFELMANIRQKVAENTQVSEKTQCFNVSHVHGKTIWILFSPDWSLNWRMVI